MFYSSGWSHLYFTVVCAPLYELVTYIFTAVVLNRQWIDTSLLPLFNRLLDCQSPGISFARSKLRSSSCYRLFRIIAIPIMTITSVAKDENILPEGMMTLMEQLTVSSSSFQYMHESIGTGPTVARSRLRSTVDGTFIDLNLE